MTTQCAPIVTGPPSATTTAPKRMRLSAPMVTSPQTVAVGATHAEGSMRGCLPRCSRIMAPFLLYAPDEAAGSEEPCRIEGPLHGPHERETGAGIAPHLET